MKILQINCVYGYGSTGKITRDLHYGIQAAGHTSVVIYGRRQKTDEPGVYKLCPEWYAKLTNLRSRVDGMVYGGAYLPTAAIIRRIRKEKPDIVHLQCINGYFCNIFRLLKFLKKQHIPTVLTLHAEFMYTATCGYADTCEQFRDGCKNCPRYKQETHAIVDRAAAAWKKMHAIYKDWETLTVRGCSDWITRRALSSGEMANRDVKTLHNGIDVEGLFHPDGSAPDAIREKYGIAHDKKLILYVAPEFSDRKGFDLVLELVEKAKDLPFHFLLVGDRANIGASNVTVAGKLSDQKALAMHYAAADVLLITSKQENYPTVCLEAQCCGTAVAGYDIGGVGETIRPGMGGVVPMGDSDAMLKLLQDLTETKPSPEAVDAARSYHSKQRMVADYLALYREILS